MILCLLQNAWARDERSAAWMRADRRHWLYATAKSRSGQRLRVLFGEDCFEEQHVYFANTTPEVALRSSGRLPADLIHVKATIGQVLPVCLVACGVQAAHVAWKVWPGSLLCLPHPAHRLLTNQLLLDARPYLECPERFRVSLRQCKGYVETIQLGAYQPA